MASLLSAIEKLSDRDIGLLAESIGPAPKKSDAPRLDHPNLWWNNLSNLQKAIRRGDVEQAADSAYRLHGADPIRFRRRLCVIALEDVCFGDLALVATILGYVTRTASNRCSSEDLGICLTLTHSLALTVKDRSACELAVASIHPPGRAPGILRTGQLPPAEQARIYASETAEPWVRCLAGRALSGNLSLEGRRVGRRDAGALWKALAHIDTPEIVRFIAEAGVRLGGEAAGLALDIPILYPAMKSRSITVEENVLPNAEAIRGLLSPSYDMHTRVGLRALSSYASACGELRRICRDTGANPRRIVGNLAFMAEGSVVNEEIRCRLGDELSAKNEKAQCEAIGLPYAALEEAKQAFLDSLDTLNGLRSRDALHEARALGLSGD